MTEPALKKVAEGGKVNPETGRSEAFDELVLSHLDMMYAVALKLTRNPVNAQDLTQATLLKALRFHNKFKEGTYIKAWLLTILRNTFINEYRRKVRRPTFVELSGTEQAPSTNLDPDVPIGPVGETYEEMKDLLDDEVNQAIEELPAEFRQAVILADIEDKSYKQISDIMECPLGTVMSRLYRGRKLLRERLAAYAEEQGVHKPNAKS